MAKLAFCGNDCNECPRYIVTQSGEEEHLKEVAALWKKVGYRNEIAKMENTMPLVKISLCKGRSKEEKKALLDAVHSALVDSFKIPENDRNQRIFEFEPENFEIPEGKTSNYTLIEIAVFPGKSIDAKGRLYKTIVGNFLKLKIQPSDILIVLQEPRLENWGIRGGYPANEVDIGFKLDV